MHCWTGEGDGDGEGVGDGLGDGVGDGEGSAPDIDPASFLWEKVGYESNENRSQV